MCHDLLEDANLWRRLSELDRQIAAQVQSQGCPCGGVLHRACYPRKPRGAARKLLTEQYESRLSFCCNKEGCRRRTTPPSVRYLGRRVYLGVIVTLACAITHGLTFQRRDYLIERLRVDRRTFKRWLTWWHEQFPQSALWRTLRAQLPSPIVAQDLPGALLGVIHAKNLTVRLIRFLALVMPLTTCSCPHYPTLTVQPQKMPM